MYSPTCNQRKLKTGCTSIIVQYVYYRPGDFLLRVSNLSPEPFINIQVSSITRPGSRPTNLWQADWRVFTYGPAILVLTRWDFVKSPFTSAYLKKTKIFGYPESATFRPIWLRRRVCADLSVGWTYMSKSPFSHNQAHLFRNSFIQQHLTHPT